MVVDLRGKVPHGTRVVRIQTNMRIYWDQILVDASGQTFPTTLTRLDPIVANLTWRGFSAEVTPDGREPIGYDYARVTRVSPWKQMIGRYTREGDVRPLLNRTDDKFVISRPGDEIALSFDATALPPLAPGMSRTFLLYADGYSKEMDLNSASPDTVAPLPFHGMTQISVRRARSVSADARITRRIEPRTTPGGSSGGWFRLWTVGCQASGLLRLQAPSVFTPRVSVKGTHQTRERFDNGGAAGTHVLGIRLFQETEAMRPVQRSSGPRTPTRAQC